MAEVVVVALPLGVRVGVRVGVGSFVFWDVMLVIYVMCHIINGLHMCHMLCAQGMMSMAHEGCVPCLICIILYVWDDWREGHAS